MLTSENGASRSDTSGSDVSGSDEPWVLVATFRDLPEAHLAVGVLESQGLHPKLTDEFTVGTDWLVSIAIGGVGVGVPESQEEAARALLEGDALGSPNTAGSGNHIELPEDLAEGIPLELREDPEALADSEDSYFEEHSSSKRFRAATAIVLMAPVLWPLMLIAWLWRRVPGSFSKSIHDKS